jgi:hypothetical protein
MLPYSWTVIRALDAAVCAAIAGNFGSVARVCHEEADVGEPFACTGINLGNIVVKN